MCWHLWRTLAGNWHMPQHPVHSGQAVSHKEAPGVAPSANLLASITTPGEGAGNKQGPHCSHPACPRHWLAVQSATEAGWGQARRRAGCTDLQGALAHPPVRVSTPHLMAVAAAEGHSWAGLLPLPSILMGYFYQSCNGFYSRRQKILVKLCLRSSPAQEKAPSLRQGLHRSSMVLAPPVPSACPGQGPVQPDSRPQPARARSDSQKPN